MEASVFPHTLSYVSLPSGCPRVVSFYNKLMIFKYSVSLCSVSHSSKLIEPEQDVVGTLKAQVITWTCSDLCLKCVGVGVQSCVTEPSLKHLMPPLGRQHWNLVEL